MDERLYRFLMRTAIVLTLAWVGWSIYDSLIRVEDPADHAYHAGNTAFEDGRFERALQRYQEALETSPQHIYALRGKARSLTMLGRYQDALETFDSAIAFAPEFAGSYANRGILLDRMGRYQEAIADYQHALRLDSSIADGPGWLTRFLRLQTESPPTIADRVGYLQEQLAKPAAERVLRMPETDQAQRPYKQ